MAKDKFTLDFGKIESAIAGPVSREPRKIFSTLNRNPRFKRPTDEQGEVLDRWFSERTRSDNTVKMNTGSGKTLVGLLMLQSCLNEEFGPTVYITPDNYLAEQVKSEAKDLGIAVTSDEHDPEFMRGTATLVVNIKKLINGKSTFGVGTERISIGSLVIDDAHACLATVAEQFSLQISRSHPVYSKLFGLFQGDLEKQSYAGTLDLRANDPHALMAVPFWSWQDHKTEVIKLLHEHRADEEVMWGWPLLNSVIPLCECVFGPTHLEIAPRCLPIDAIPSFTRTKRKIYMTATLADDGILVTHFGADSKSVTDPIRPKGAGDIGDRMILAPQEITPGITINDIKDLASKLSKKINVVVIVPSNRKALEWRPIAQQVLDKKNISEGVESLKKGHIGLTVLINKYDGIDLPGAACELLILDGLPEVYGLLERIELAKMSGTEVQVLRQVQKLEQGMGRGVRSSEDHCVVLLLGSKLTHRINNPAVRSKFSAATQAQLKIAREVSKQAAGAPLSEIEKLMKLCLERDENWVAASRRAVAQAADVDSSYLDVAVPHVRRAFDLARQNKFEDACSEVEIAANATTDKGAKGYYKEMLAEYMHRLNPAKAQEILSAAISLNRRVTMPTEGIRYQKLDQARTTQAKSVLDFLSQFKDSNEIIIWTNALLEDLRWDPETTDEFEDAIMNLGAMLGFNSQQPERDAKKGPDNLWGIGALNYLVIECKSGATTPLIAKKDCDQLTGSMEWFVTNYGKDNQAVPLMVHPSNCFDRYSSPRADAKMIDDEHLNRLKNAVRQFSISLAEGASFKDEKRVADILQHLNLTSASLLQSFTTKYRISRT